MSSLSLFDPPTPVNRDRLARRLKALATQGVYFGTSSWKYEGWLDIVYDPQRYRVRGKVSKKRFEDTCIAEYAETFPTVCGDFSFYQFPAPAFWEKLFQTTPAGLHFSLKVPEEITVKTFPSHPRYGARGGQDNPRFLDHEMFAALFAEPLSPFAGRIDALIFEFGAFPRKTFADAEHFAETLGAFLRRLPKGFRYAVEIRNPEFLAPEYLAVLREHGCAHVFNAWTRMPEVPVQLTIPDVFTADFVVVRALLRQGRPYEEAVQAFSPYDKVQDPNPELRQALRDLVVRAKDVRQPAFIYVNNRLEGSAPETIQAVTAESDE